MSLVSPASGMPLRADGPDALTDGTARWPVIDGIPYLRVGRTALVAGILERLDARDRTGALVLVLGDQDDWWRGPVANPEAIARLVREQDRLSLREAMELLNWGPVADYFAHRWSDPTFIAGLGLVEAYWNAPRRAFELACGIGHHLRALAQQGVAVSGGDVVFAKLWIARHWMVPSAELICFDAAAEWPVGDARFDLVACHDAFYFLEPKPWICDRLRAMTNDRLLVSHVHNRNWPNFSAGHAIDSAELEALFPDGVFHDDAELQRAMIEGRAPVASRPSRLGRVEAFSIAEGRSLTSARPVTGGVAMPAIGTALRRNPLYREDGVLQWPSERYALEYGTRSTLGPRTDCPPNAVNDASVEGWVRRRELVDLPERW